MPRDVAGSAPGRAPRRPGPSRGIPNACPGSAAPPAARPRGLPRRLRLRDDSQAAPRKASTERLIFRGPWQPGVVVNRKLWPCRQRPCRTMRDPYRDHRPSCPRAANAPRSSSDQVYSPLTNAAPHCESSILAASESILNRLGSTLKVQNCIHSQSILAPVCTAARWLRRATAAADPDSPRVRLLLGVPDLSVLRLRCLPLDGLTALVVKRRLAPSVALGFHPNACIASILSELFSFWQTFS